jgi:RNA polymerase sigma factor for flagellar operon FliA
LSPKPQKVKTREKAVGSSAKGATAKSSKATSKASTAAKAGPTASDVVGEEVAEKPLSREAIKAKREEVAKGLWAIYHEDRSDENRNALVVHYRPLIREIARRFAARLPRSVPRGDLETASSLGLMSAIAGFDPERGVRFESYCELRVKGALLDELRTQDWLPRPWRHSLEERKRTEERLRRELNREPYHEELAEAMGMTLEYYDKRFGVGLPGAPTGSMPSGEGADDGMPTLEVVADPEADAPHEALSRTEILSLAKGHLSDQEIAIINFKYFNDFPMREIGELTGLSESRVCKIHARLLDRLKDRFRVNELEG